MRPNFRHEGRLRQMLYAGLDIHKAVFQVVVLDPDSGELCESRFEPSRERLGDWAMEWQGKLAAVAIEATTGWRWVARELQAKGFEVHLVDPGRASALRGRRRQPKTDRLDARWLALLLARELLSECEAWLPPAEKRAVARPDTVAEGAQPVSAPPLRPRRPALPGAPDDLRGRPDPRLPPARRDRRRSPLPATTAAGARQWARPERDRIGRQQAPRPPRQAGITASPLGPGRGRQPQSPPQQPRPRPLHQHRPPLRPRPGKADRRPQNRPPQLPRPARSGSSLNSRSPRRANDQGPNDRTQLAASSQCTWQSNNLPRSGNEPPREPQPDLLRRTSARRYRFGPNLLAPTC